MPRQDSASTPQGGTKRGDVVCRDNHRLNVEGPDLIEVRIDEIGRTGARRFHEHEPTGTCHSSRPGCNAVARHVPAVRQVIGFLQPSARRKDRHMPQIERAANTLGIADENTPFEPRGHEVRTLLHPEHRHPVRGIVRQVERAIDVSHDLGKGSSAGEDDKPRSVGGVTNDREHRREVLRMRDQAATDFDDHIHKGSGISAHSVNPESRVPNPEPRASSLETS